MDFKILSLKQKYFKECTTESLENLLKACFRAGISNVRIDDLIDICSPWDLIKNYKIGDTKIIQDKVVSELNKHFTVLDPNESTYIYCGEVKTYSSYFIPIKQNPLIFKYGSNYVRLDSDFVIVLKDSADKKDFIVQADVTMGDFTLQTSSYVLNMNLLPYFDTILSFLLYEISNIGDGFNLDPNAIHTYNLNSHRFSTKIEP